MQSAHSIQDYLDVVKGGIAKKFGDGKPKRVVIVGAGLAGLVAGYELRRPGHTPIILEGKMLKKASHLVNKYQSKINVHSFICTSPDDSIYI